MYHLEKRKFFELTLSNALKTPFYQAHWSQIDLKKVTVDSLHKLPLVTKDEIRNAGPSAQIREGLRANEVFTMGTTGVPLVTVRGEREQKFIRQYFNSLHDKKPAHAKLLRGLKINNPYHGSHIAVPARIHCHRIGIYDIGSFSHGRKVLTNLHSDENVESHCTMLIGLERCLRAFTTDTQRLFPQGLRTHLDYVISYGEYLTQKWRRLFEETWTCKVVDKFSLSEVFGGATQSPICGWLHFDPFVIPEVVSLNTLESITEGIGVLVLTTLYPFQEAQPLIRYITNDLVEVTHTNSSKSGVLAIKPLGRAQYGVPLLGTDRWLLTPASILEVIDAAPEIKRRPLFRDSEQVKDPFMIGLPKYQVSNKKAHEVQAITVRIEMEDRGDEALSKKICKRIYLGLLNNNSNLKQAIESQKATLNIVVDEIVEPDVIFYST
jgi:phenylacetate-coenzyme A ligase PaaK-like adenylate-forming protein